MLEQLLQEFSGLVSGPDADIPLDRCALLIARAVQPQLDIEHYMQLLDLMAEHLRLRVVGVSDPVGVLAELNRYLYEDEGFRGNTDSYYDPRNSFLNEVLDRKVGIPVSLSILYIELARRLGVVLDGVGLPGHFLVKRQWAGGETFIDPFHEGVELSEADCLARLENLYGSQVDLEPHFLEALPRRRILTRLLNNLKAIYLHAQDLESAIRMVDLALIIDPDHADEYRNRGLLALQAECFGQAWSDLETYLAMRPDAEDRESIQQLLWTAQRMASTVN